MDRHTVILHADDFGLNPAVNRGIARAFREGLLTSTSLLANAPAAEAACQAWPHILEEQRRACVDSNSIRHQIDDLSQLFDFGIHLNLTQGRPLTGERYPKELLDGTGCFPGIGAVFRRLLFTPSRWREAVSAELQAQIEWMCDHQWRPTHLNGHQYVELLPAVSEMIPGLMQRYAIPVVRVALESGLSHRVLTQGRGMAWGLGLIKRLFAQRFLRRLRTSSAIFPDQFFGTAHAGRIDHATLCGFFTQASGYFTTEIGLHPGEEPDPGEAGPVAGQLGPGREWNDPLAHWRAQELRLLCSPELGSELLQRNLRLGRLHTLGATPS